MNLVAFPIAMGKTPVAIGSRVPVCPTFLIPSFFLMIATTSWEVIFGALLMFIIPEYSASMAAFNSDFISLTASAIGL